MENIYSVLIFYFISKLGLVFGDCPIDTFSCGNGDCIDKKFVCDSVIDCKRVLGEIEGRDELDCIDHENYCSHDRNLQRLPDSPLSRLIDTGYNVVRGAFSNVRMFQSERYTGGCQAIERVLEDGSKIFYRTPHNLANWTFFEERDPEAVDFRLEVYESAFAGLKELKRHRTVSDIGFYSDLYLSIYGQFGGDRSISLLDYLRRDRKIDAGYPFVRIVAEIRTGKYRMKAPQDLALHNDLFLPGFLQAVRAAHEDQRPNGSTSEQKFMNIFRRSGTHYVSDGTFGGVYEIQVHRGDCAASGKQGDVPYLAMQDIGLCVQALVVRRYKGDDISLYSPWDIPECQNLTSILPSKIGPRPYDFITTSYITGGHTLLTKALEASALVFDLPFGLTRQEFIPWMQSLSDFPAPIDLRLTPICDLITPALSDSWTVAKVACQETLLKYIRLCDQLARTRTCTPGINYGRVSTDKYSHMCPLELGDNCVSARSSYGSCPYVSRSGCNRILSDLLAWFYFYCMFLYLTKD